MKKILIMISILFLFTGCNKETKKPALEEESNNQIIENQDMNGIIITNIVLKKEKNFMVLTALLKNSTDKDIEINSFNILLKDKNDQVLLSITGYIGSIIKQNDSKNFITNIDQIVDNVSKIEFVMIS